MRRPPNVGPIHQVAPKEIAVPESGADPVLAKDSRPRAWRGAVLLAAPLACRRILLTSPGRVESGERQSLDDVTWRDASGQGSPAAKAQMIRVIEDQPDDSTYDDILRELAFARMVERGLADSDAERSVSHEKMQRISKSLRR